MSDNVIMFPRKEVLFQGNVRKQVEASVAPYTEKPQETIQAVEDALCNAIVSGLRDIAIKIGTQIGDSLARKACREPKRTTATK